MEITKRLRSDNISELNKNTRRRRQVNCCFARFSFRRNAISYGITTRPVSRSPMARLPTRRFIRSRSRRNFAKLTIISRFPAIIGSMIIASIMISVSLIGPRFEELSARMSVALRQVMLLRPVPCVASVGTCIAPQTDYCSPVTKLAKS